MLVALTINLDFSVVLLQHHPTFVMKSTNACMHVHLAEQWSVLYREFFNLKRSINALRIFHRPIPSLLPDFFSIFSLSSLSIVWIKPRSCVSSQSCDSPSVSLIHSLLPSNPLLFSSFSFFFSALLVVPTSLRSFLVHLAPETYWRLANYSRGSKTWDWSWHLLDAPIELPSLRTPDKEDDDIDDAEDDGGGDGDNHNLLLDKKVHLSLSPSSHPSSMFAEIHCRDVSW